MSHPLEDHGAAALRERAVRFLELFNQDDLEGVLASFAEDGIFIDHEGKAHQGGAALREAYAPLLGGAAGKMRYTANETVVDAPAGKAMITWTMTLTTGGADHRIRGLDILHYDGDRLIAKNSFCKAKAVMLE